MPIEIECHYTEPPHIHEYPDDWIFGGANDLDPRADPRWKPTTYTYYDKDTTEIFVTQTPLCDDEALDEFTKVAQFRGADPHWIAVRRPGGQREMLPWLYDRATDTVYPAGG